jgi:hypothetical protein
MKASEIKRYSDFMAGVHYAEEKLRKRLAVLFFEEDVVAPESEDSAFLTHLGQERARKNPTPKPRRKA